MSNEQKPFTWDKKKVLAILLLVLTLSLVFLYRGSRVEAIPSATEDNPKFVLSSWDYPDEYGQGIEAIEVYENSTSSWVLYDTYPYNEATNIDWNESLGIKLRVYTWFNSTLTGASTSNEGKLYQRHNVIVTNFSSTVFSKQNFTFVASDLGIDPPMWYYTYDVVLNFLPDWGQTYTVTVDYEVYYDDGSGATSLLTATDGSTDADTPTGSYTDTHSVNDVFFGGTDPVNMFVILWVEFSEEIVGFNYSAYWNSSHSSDIYIYNHGISDWSLLDSSPNGEGAPLAWDNDTVDNGNYYNETTIGFKFYCESIAPPVEINIDYFQVLLIEEPGWHTVSNLDLMFTTPLLPPIPQWMFDFVLIVMGLCMIPISTLYLAYGWNHDRSSARVFYGLMIFILGWAFLVAGIMP